LRRWSHEQTQSIEQAFTSPATRTVGGLIAGALFVLPSLLILIGLSWIYLRFGDMPLVAGIFYGLKPAVTALVLHAAHRIGTRALKNRWMWAISAITAAVVGVILQLALFFCVPRALAPRVRWAV